MIRIDLGKGDGGKPAKKGLGGINFDFGFLKMPNWGSGGGGGKLSKLGGDMKGVFIFGVAFAIACLPHLFFTQFRTFVIEQHESSKQKLEESAQVIKGEIAKLTQFKRELESYEEQRTLVKQRLEVVRNLLSNRGTPVSVLDAIGQSLPPRAWLAEMDFDAPGSRVALSGSALSNDEISDFLDKLGESVFLSDVKLEEMSTGASLNLNGAELRTFKISARPKLKPTGMTPAEAGGAAAAAPAGGTQP